MRAFATTTELMPHQLDAATKMLPTRVGGLFMEMGTGKSRTAIELARVRARKIDKFVWFCPVSLKETVRQEILKHTDCRPSDICVFDDKINEQNIPKADWYVVGIESMSASARTVFTVNNLITDRTFVALDESTYCKNHRAERTERITRISERSRYRLIMTGTPLTQGVVDLYAQMRFLSPKILGYRSFYSFAANHLEYSELYPGMIVRTHNEEYLAAKIKPYVYQVTKEECMTLPKKLYESRYFTMTEEQREMYEYAKHRFLWEEAQYADPFMDRVRIFRLFSALQQIVSGFWNVDGKLVELPHERLDMLMHTVWMIPSHEKVIIWAKYHYDIQQIGRALENEYGPDAVAYYYGAIPEKKRNEEIEKFRREARFLVATQGTGGHGLTLNEAAYTIFYNNGFKYSERIQAEDRNHRHGQARRPTYIDIRCAKSIDDRISSAIASKGNVVERFRKEVQRVRESGRKERIRELILSL